MKELEWPFDADEILSNRGRIKRDLLSNSSAFINKKVAILGGSTTHDIKVVLELFLLHYGIQADFYESEYNRFYEDAVFENQELAAFRPDIVYIHTSNRNIMNYPSVGQPEVEITKMLEMEYAKFEEIWTGIREKYACPVIQNNFEYPYYRLLGNKDASDPHGRVNYITRLNMKFYEYAQKNANFYINDLNYISSDFGLKEWSDPFFWYMYKYALNLSAVPYLAFNIANIIKSLFGRNKKGYVLDLDNTCWGGVIGDDGVDHIELGPEVSGGQVYSEFQQYIKEHKKLGVLLNINSKNDRENAIAGLKHPDSALKEDDFAVIKANWASKDQNFVEIAQELNLLPESLVFVDDNPAEREIVRTQIPGVCAPEIGSPEQYISVLSHSGFFEVTELSEDDLKRTAMYEENIKRNALQKTFENYRDYLLSLEMRAVIRPFEPIYITRITQLTNKSNQFNLTTRRYTQTEIEQIAVNENYIALYGKLEDKFGDNGVVSVVIGRVQGKELRVELWLMSCRVLKRDMEFAMMDVLAAKAVEKHLEVIRGYYYPTAKNKMVKDFYAVQGFEKVREDADGNTEWALELTQDYIQKNTVIRVEE